MWKRVVFIACISAIGFLFCGCGIKRPPQNVFPGSVDYQERVKTFRITAEEAYEIALEQAQEDNKLQFLSKKPTVLNKRWYVFSMPQGSGANLQGYHVHGDSGQVKFHGRSQTVTSTR